MAGIAEGDLYHADAACLALMKSILASGARRGRARHRAAVCSKREEPDVLSEVGVLGVLLAQESLVAGTRNGRDRHSLVVAI